MTSWEHYEKKMETNKKQNGINATKKSHVQNVVFDNIIILKEQSKCIPRKPIIKDKISDK